MADPYEGDPWAVDWEAYQANQAAAQETPMGSEGWGWKGFQTPSARYGWLADMERGKPADWRGNTEVAEQLAAKRQLPGWPGYKGLPTEYGKAEQARWPVAPRATAAEWTPEYWQQEMEARQFQARATGTPYGLPMGIYENMTPEQMAMVKEAQAALGSYIKDAVIPRAVNVPPPQFRDAYSSMADFRSDMMAQGYYPALAQKGNTVLGGRGATYQAGNTEGIPEETWYYTIMAKGPDGAWGNVFDAGLRTMPQSYENVTWPGGEPKVEPQGVGLYVYNVQDTLARIGGTEPGFWGLPTVGKPPPFSLTPTADYLARGGPGAGPETIKANAQKAVQQFTPHDWLVGNADKRAQIRAIVEQTGQNFNDWLSALQQTWPVEPIPNVRWRR